MAGTITKLAQKWDTQGKIVESYKNTSISRTQGNDLLIECAKGDVFPRTQLMDVISEWEMPQHEEFKDRNLWSLFNAATEHLKPRESSNGSTVWLLPIRTERLHNILDPIAGVEILSPEDQASTIAI